MTVVWFVSVEAPGARAEWDVATLGAPEPYDLFSVRRPASGALSRHVPASVYSATTGGHLVVESGLEHDLVRWLDRRAEVVHLVAQPVLLHFPREPGRAPTHLPDLLSVTADGSVTVWDARPSARQDDLFYHRAELTARACRRVGWCYEIFRGLSVPARMNLLWLTGYRRPMPWHETRRAELDTVVDAHGSTVGRVFEVDDGSGELIATMWHLIWTGELSVDLVSRIDRSTPLNWEPDR